MESDRSGARGCRHVEIRSRFTTQAKIFHQEAHVPPNEQGTPRIDSSPSRQSFEQLGKQLGIKHLSEWYSVRASDVSRFSGKELTRRDLFLALVEAFPEHSWDRSGFCRPRGYWNDAGNHREGLEWLGARLGVREVTDWDGVTVVDVVKEGGAGLLKRYGGSLSSALAAVYPERDWKAGRSGHRRGHWESVVNRREWFERFGVEMRVERMEDWYGVKYRDVLDRGGAGILAIYKGSLAAALQSLFPEHEWQPWRFSKVPNNFWKDSQNVRRWFEWLAPQVKVAKMEDWYSVTTELVVERGGGGMLKCFGFSLSAALECAYPEHKWELWRFSNPPRRLQNQNEDVKGMVLWLAKQFHVDKLEEWYRIPLQQIKRQIPLTVQDRYGGLFELFSGVYPEHEWDQEKLSEGRAPPKSSQRILKLRVQEIFPNTGICATLEVDLAVVHEDYLHPELQFDSGHGMQLDLFIPKLSLAFEYQGEQHFQNLNSFAPLALYSERDKQKRKACKGHGITLVEVPYWWDFGKDSLVATIHELRPDIFPNSGPGKPISSQDPPAF